MINLKEALDLVVIERDRQNKKWGFPQNNTPFEWVSILLEEVGEFAQAMNNACMNGRQGNNFQAMLEITQVCAVALSIMEHMYPREDNS